MRLPEVADEIAGATTATVRAASAKVADVFDTTVRLGVTGLARSGKTVFITSLVRALLTSAAEPPLRRIAGLPGLTVYLEPQPDDEIPRFAYEAHLESLLSDPAVWPESTRRISQLRLTLEWDGQDLARRLLGLRQRLHIDIVDYPGEWLVDLGLIGQDYATWSAGALAAAQSPRRQVAAGDFLRFLATLPAATNPEASAIEGARLYTAYLAEVRTREAHLSILGPGRFLMPGDLEGSPLLTFFPHPHRPTDSDRAPLIDLLNRRFESYKAKVAVPFFRDHFARLDRQIVLVDILSALESGPDALGELENSLDGLLGAFRIGPSSWWNVLSGRRIDRILFAASKADHLNRSSHNRLAAILEKAVARAQLRGETAGITTRSVAIAALRATEDVETHRGSERFESIRGRPLAGETIGSRRYDGATAAVVFPGDLPADPLDAFDAEVITPGLHRFVRFAPPASATLGKSWPHIGLGTAMDFLIGDDLP